MCVRQGLPLPDAIKNAPQLFLGLELYFQGFLELNDERQIGMAAGPIPWRALQQYCEVYDIVGDQKEDFFFHIKSLDAEFLRWQGEQSKG